LSNCTPIIIIIIITAATTTTTTKYSCSHLSVFLMYHMRHAPCRSILGLRVQFTQNEHVTQSLTGHYYYYYYYINITPEMQILKHRKIQVFFARM